MNYILSMFKRSSPLLRSSEILTSAVNLIQPFTMSTRNSSSSLVNRLDGKVAIVTASTDGYE